MVCASAEEVQARLGLWALLPLLRAEAGGGATNVGGAGDDAGCDDAAVGRRSLLHRRARAEVDEALKGSLERRRRRLEQRVSLLSGGSGGVGGQSDAGASSQRASHAQSTTAQQSVPTTAASTQTEDWAQQTHTRVSAELRAACTKALQTAARAARPLKKEFGPTRSQRNLPDPPEKKDPIVPEKVTMRGTLDNLQRNISSRERQISSLRHQLGICQRIHRERSDDAETVDVDHQVLLNDPNQLKKVHRDRIHRRLRRIAELEKNLDRVQWQATHYEKLGQQQRTFFLQSERIGVSGGPEVVARHPCGDIALVPEPPSMSSEQPEVWDVGTAVANPYVCDSWPFEPNVLARRSPQDWPLERLSEETPKQLAEANRPANAFERHNFRLPMPGRESDEEDDRYGGPTETSRSL